MREIKFRGRSVHTDDWCYGSLINNPDEPCICGFDIWNNGVDEWSEEKVELDTVGQFTGLHDKNGKEIYEGDILVRKAICGWGTHEGEPLKVEFMNGAFGFRLYRGETYEEFEWLCKEHNWSDMGASGETKYEYVVICETAERR